MILGADIKTQRVKREAQTILKTLAYFEIFDYPLTVEEIRNFLDHSVSESAFRSALEQLVSSQVIFKIDKFYSLENKWQKAEKRLLGNKRAQKLLQTAYKIGTFLCKFPYVRAVGISGSLSKNYAGKKEDIDFFIITKANRLWIARTILHLFKKITFLFRRQHYYCMNYFIDERALVVQERNIYTATEVVTLLPVAGSPAMNTFFDSNDWTKDWFPLYVNEQRLAISDKDSFLKKPAEWLFEKMGEKLDDFLFQWTSRRWEKKERLGRRNSKGRVMNLLTDKHFSKSDPEAFQEKIVALYQGKIEKLKDQWPQYFD